MNSSESPGRKNPISSPTRRRSRRRCRRGRPCRSASRDRGSPSGQHPCQHLVEGSGRRMPAGHRRVIPAEAEPIGGPWPSGGAEGAKSGKPRCARGEPPRTSRRDLCARAAGPLGPPHAAAAGRGVGEAAQRTQEAGHAPLSVGEEDRGERHRLDREPQIPHLDGVGHRHPLRPNVGRDPCAPPRPGPARRLHVARVVRSGSSPRRTAVPWKRVPSSSQPAVHVQPRSTSRTPHEWSRWPMASRAIDSSPTSTSPCTDTAPRSGWCRAGRRRRRRRVPLEVEAEGHPLAAGVAVHLGRVVEAEGERLAAEGHVVERHLDRVVGPQALAPQLERAGGRRATVWSTTVTSGRPSPTSRPSTRRRVCWGRGRCARSPQRAVGRGEVEVPRLVPPRLGTHGVVALVGGGQPSRRGGGHGASMARPLRR